MDGVVTTLYNSGVGWFNDILDVRVFFEADLETYSAIPHVYKDMSGTSHVENYRPLFSSGAPIRGFIRVTPPEGRVVPHNGVRVRLESGFFTLDDFNTKDLFEKELDVAGAGSFSATVDIPFYISGGSLCESYEGDLFSIRHSLIATVLRPWYTFEVSTTVPFAVQRVHSVPLPAAYDAAARKSAITAAAASVASAAAAAAGGGTGLDNAATIHSENVSAAAAATAADLGAQLAMYTQQELTIDDVEHGGSIVFTFDKGCYELSEKLTGCIAFSDISAPIVLVKLAVVRIELADGEVNDSVVFDDAILDARRWKARKLQRRGVNALTALARANAAALPHTVTPGEEQLEAEGDRDWTPAADDYEEGAEPDADLPVQGDVSLSVELDFSQINVTPTQVIDAVGRGASLDDDEHPPSAATGDNAAHDSEVSVRYFVRVTVYTAFDVGSRKWNAAELVLFRDRLYGSEVPVERLPVPLENLALERKAAAVQAATAAASASASHYHGVSAAVAMPLPQPMTQPFSLSMFNVGKAGVSASTGGASSPTTGPGAGLLKGRAVPAPGATISSPHLSRQGSGFGGFASPLGTGGHASTRGVGNGGFGGDSTGGSSPHHDLGAFSDSAEAGHLSDFLTRAVQVNAPGGDAEH